MFIFSIIFLLIFIITIRATISIILKLFLFGEKKLYYGGVFSESISRFYYFAFPIYAFLNIVIGFIITNVIIIKIQRNQRIFFSFLFVSILTSYLGDFIYLALEYIRAWQSLNAFGKFFVSFISLTPIFVLSGLLVMAGGIGAQFLLLKYPNIAYTLHKKIISFLLEAKTIIYTLKNSAMQQEGIVIISLFSVSLLLRLFFAKGLYDSDDVAYFYNAMLIADYSFNSVLTLSTDVFYLWSVGYSIFLAFFFIVFGSSVALAVGINAILGSLSVICVYLITKNLINDINCAILTSIFLIFHPIHIYGSITVLADIPGLFFLTGAIYLLLKMIKTSRLRYFYLFYIFLSMGCLLRYPNLLILLILGLFGLSVKDGLETLIIKKETVIGLLFLVLAMIPQMLYNAQHHGNPFVTGYQYYSDEAGFKGYLNAIDATQRFLLLAYNYITYLFSFNFISPFFVPFLILGVRELVLNREIDQLRMLTSWFSTYFLFFSFAYWGRGGKRHILSFAIPLIIIGSYGIIEFFKKLDRFQGFRNKYFFRSIIEAGILLGIILPFGFFSINTINLFVNSNIRSYRRGALVTRYYNVTDPSTRYFFWVDLIGRHTITELYVHYFFWLELIGHAISLLLLLYFIINPIIKRNIAVLFNK